MCHKLRLHGKTGSTQTLSQIDASNSFPVHQQVTLTNLSEVREFEVPDIPLEPEGPSHTIRLTRTLYIDASDFRRTDSPSYFGLAPGKVGFEFLRVSGHGLD